jgi:hypothetical protein
MRFMKKLQYYDIINIKKTYVRTHGVQFRSKLLDLPTIYSSEPKVGNLGE